MKPTPPILIIDPAVRVPELGCLNQITAMSKLPVTYHLPGLFGFDSFEAETKKIAGIIVLGSGASVYDKLPWQKPLNRRLLKWMNAKIPTLGICYGHQLIAHLYGGKVEFLFSDRRKLAGFRKVGLQKNRLWKNKKLRGELFVSHREVVTKVPASMAIVGSSAVSTADALAHRKLPIWTFQPHPEATIGFLKAHGGNRGNLDFGRSLVQGFLDYCFKHK